MNTNFDVIKNTENSNNDIINVNIDTMTVSARDLHDALEVKTAFKDWFPRMCEYGFSENVDFNQLKNEQVRLEGKRQVKREIMDYQLSIDMAKEICMIQRTDKGKQVRKYFIDLEKAWNTPEQVMARALKLADSKIKELSAINENLAKENEIMKPKAKFADLVDKSHNASTMNQFSKYIQNECGGTNIGRNRMMRWLREHGILMKDNTPYQRYINNGWLTLGEKTLANGTTVPVPLITGKGQRPLAYMIIKDLCDNIYD